MVETHVPPHLAPSSTEREHLEEAHHEIRTSLTVLRSNVALVRKELQGEPTRAELRALQAHLIELDLAVDRLERLAREMRFWHDAGRPEWPVA